MKILKLNFILMLSLALTIMSCTDKEDDNATLNLNISGLEDLGTDYAYEGWIIVDGSPITTGIFSVDDNGNLSESSFELDKEMLDKATTFVLTIEPSPDNDPAPSDVHILAGDFANNSASLTIGHNAALGNDFSTATGGYILATPTDGNGDINEDSGVWFLDPMAGPGPGLDLPTLPAGWAYEGWAVINGTPVSTGTFTSVNGADDSGIYSGDAGGPAFPGEDFLQNAPGDLSFPTTLGGGAIVISVEPSPDNSPAPFTLKPLLHNVAENPVTHAFTQMQNTGAKDKITGNVTR